MSRILQGIFLLGVVVVPLVQVVVFWRLEWALQAASEGIGPAMVLGFDPTGAEFLNGPVTWQMQVCGFLVALPSTALTGIMLWKLSRLFRNYAREEVFSVFNVRAIQLVGMLLLARELWRPVEDGLMSMVMTMSNPPGQHMLAIGLDSSDITAMVAALTIIVAGHVMEQARELHSEAELTI